MANNNKYKVKNKRLSKYLYSLGFDRQYCHDEESEYWLFDISENFMESLDFTFICAKNIDMCESLILRYIENNGILSDYNSFNWSYIDGELKLNENIIMPYQFYCKNIG